MEVGNLNENLKSEDEFDFEDIPDYIIDIKQEILDQDVSQSICTSDGNEKCMPSYIASESFEEVTNMDECSSNQNTKITGQDKEARITEEEKNQAKDYIQSFTSNHSRSKGTKIKKCDLCNYQTRRTNNFKRHLLCHNSRKDIVHKCLECEFQTTDECGIYKHMGLHSNSDNSERQTCEQCKIQKSKKRIRSQRNLAIVPDNTKECYYQNCRNSDKLHVFSHKGVTEVTIYKCSECSYRTNRKSNLNHHSLRHKNVDELYMYECYHCSYQTFSKCHLRKHLLTHRSSSEVQVFQCTQCGYHSKYRADLAVHILRHKNRSEVKMHKCTECSYEAIRKCDLNRHLLLHKSANGVKTHNCPKCEYKTLDKGSFNKHIVSHIIANKNKELMAN